MLTIETELEVDGRFIAEIPELPAVMAYGRTRKEAAVKVRAIALRTLADRLDQGEFVPQLPRIFSPYDGLAVRRAYGSCSASEGRMATRHTGYHPNDL